MLTKELLQNPSMLTDKQQLHLFIRPTGLKTSKNGHVTLTNCYSARKNIRLMLIVNINSKLFYCNIFHKGGALKGEKIN